MISARDNTRGSGIEGYIVKEVVGEQEVTTPTSEEEGWEVGTSNHKTTQSYDNGTYYVYAKDKAGNISKGKKVVIEKVDKEVPTCTLRINPNGTKTGYKTLTIVTEDEHIDFEGYTWEGMENKNDVVKVTENNTYTAHLTDLAGNKGECSATVTTIDKENLDTSGANEPVLSDNMVPVYYDNQNNVWRKAEEANTNEEYKWYDYNNKMWANAVTVEESVRDSLVQASVGEVIPMDKINTMLVWIPRFDAVVPKNQDVQNPSPIEVTFKKENEAAIDAFTFGEKSLSGLWIGKFEISSNIPCEAGNNGNTECELTTIKPKVIPDVLSWRGASIFTFFDSIKGMIDESNIYGLDSSVDTHMMKNREWGAAAYLTHSKYGLCDNNTCREIYINNSSDYYTGRSGGSSESASNTYGTYSYDGYKLNDNNKSEEKDMSKVASTTGNIYGIYDMSGGAAEYVMGNFYGYALTEEIEEKDVDIYEFSYEGHALNETAGWYNDDDEFVEQIYVFFTRGGASDSNKRSGIFAFNSMAGIAYIDTSSRLVITNQ